MIQDNRLPVIVPVDKRAADPRSVVVHRHAHTTDENRLSAPLRSPPGSENMLPQQTTQTHLILLWVFFAARAEERCNVHFHRRLHGHFRIRIRILVYPTGDEYDNLRGPGIPLLLASHCSSFIRKRNGFFFSYTPVVEMRMRKCRKLPSSLHMSRTSPKIASIPR